MLKTLKDHVKGGRRCAHHRQRYPKAGNDVQHEKYPGKRLHARVIIRDHHDAFLGSQSLRKLELDKRREVGIIVKDQSVVSRTGQDV